jgi:hypothetical protein
MGAAPQEEVFLLPGEKVVEVRDRMRGHFPADAGKPRASTEIAQERQKGVKRILFEVG